MKKYCSLFLIAFSIISFAQGINFTQNSWDATLKQAEKENKLIFVDAYASWCGPCKLMAKNIFTQKEVGDFYNSSFVNAKLDMEKGEGIDFAKKYRVQSYPMFLFINNKGEVVHRGVGYMEASDFITLGTKAKTAIQDFKQLEEAKTKGTLTQEESLQYFSTLLAEDRAKAKKFSEEYFAKKTNSAYTPNEISMMLSVVESPKDANFIKFRKDRAIIEKIFPKNQLDGFEKSIIIRGVLMESLTADKRNIDEKIFLSKLSPYYNPIEANAILLDYKMQRALREGNITDYTELSQKVYANTQNKSSEELNSVAWTYYEKVSDPAALKQAIRWAEESVKKSENYANTDTLANLYMKIGDKKNAKFWALKSIALAKTNNQDFESTQKLLDSIK